MLHKDEIALTAPLFKVVESAMTSNDDIHYDDAFYHEHLSSVLMSARCVVPILIQMLQPKSVIDVGCGVGTWLKAFEEAGVTDYLGLDGDYVNRNKLLVDASRFLPSDLERSTELGRVFDLAICLEVGEHLPQQRARSLVRDLGNAAPVVLFSAAIPGQGGTHHINEQWPDYWKRLFEEVGYQRFDCIRPSIWTDTRIAWWYRQNLYLFISTHKAIDLVRKLEAMGIRSQENDVELISRDVLGRFMSLSGLLREIPKAAFRGAKHRIFRHYNS